MNEIKTKNYAHVQNNKCEFFPCHKGIKKEDFNCLFCYCPLYMLGEECGGNFVYLEDSGIKDCSNCLVPHQKNSYDNIIDKFKLIIEMTKKK